MILAGSLAQPGDHAYIHSVGILEASSAQIDRIMGITQARLCIEGLAMGVTVDWYDDSRRIIHWKFERDWTWDEYHTAAAWIRAQLKTTPENGPIDVIMDLTRNRIFPRDWGANIRKAQSEEDPTWDYTIIAVGSEVIKGLLKVARTFNRNLAPHYHAVSSIEDALRLILSMRGVPAGK